MIVAVANYFPPAVRGKMKLWFVEPVPNVFVSGIRDALAQTVIDLLMQYCPADSGLLLFLETPKAPFFKIFAKGAPTKNITNLSGLQLVIEKTLQIPDGQKPAGSSAPQDASAASHSLPYHGSQLMQNVPPPVGEPLLTGDSRPSNQMNQPPVGGPPMPGAIPQNHGNAPGETTSPVCGHPIPDFTTQTPAMQGTPPMVPPAESACMLSRTSSPQPANDDSSMTAIPPPKGQPLV